MQLTHTIVLLLMKNFIHYSFSSMEDNMQYMQ